MEAKDARGNKTDDTAHEPPQRRDNGPVLAESW